ncbi:MAG TPA: hypothetical protein VLH56_05230 [Dissulfurispiraceae bacterium]|nr:hypothetical protein [Dissulfurispiraceae bacterium]
MDTKIDPNIPEIAIREKRLVKVNERPKMSKDAFSQAVVKQNLKTLIERFGFNPDEISVADLQMIADKLSHKVERVKPWTWRYLRSVLGKDYAASGILAMAIESLLPMATNARELYDKAYAVQILAIGNVKPGAVILADSHSCGFLGCPVEFVPRAWNQRYCSPECRKAEAKRKMKSNCH